MAVCYNALLAQMNTLRFFLLLFSLFLFAFVFRLQGDKQANSADVLSEKTKQATTYQTNMRGVFVQYVYPGSAIVAQQGNRVTLGTSDSTQDVLKWYRTRIPHLDTSRVKSGSSNNQTILPSLTQNGNKITVEIFKQKTIRYF